MASVNQCIRKAVHQRPPRPSPERVSKIGMFTNSGDSAFYFQHKRRAQADNARLVKQGGFVKLRFRLGMKTIGSQPRR